MNIGWIGLGNMGVPMVRNVVNAGYTVTAYNRTPKTIDIEGLKMAGDIGQAVREKDVVVLMVSDGPAIEKLLHETTVLSEMAENTLVINMSTIGVDETAKIAEVICSHGHRYMDAPVLGSVKPAMDATLTVVAGGDKADFDHVKPLFETMAKAVFHIGETGKGATMKLLVNAFLGLSVEALGETLNYGQKNGLDNHLTLDVLKNSAVWSPMIEGKRSKLENQDYAPQFALKHLRKDLNLAVQQAETVDAEMPATKRTRDVFAEAEAAGFGDLDMVSVFDFLLKQKS